MKNAVTSSPNPPLSPPYYMDDGQTAAGMPRHRPAPFKHRFLAGHPSAPGCTPRRHRFAPSRPQHGPRPLQCHRGKPAGHRPCRPCLRTWNMIYSLGRKRNKGDGSRSQTGMRVTPRHNGMTSAGYTSARTKLLSSGEVALGMRSSFQRGPCQFLSLLHLVSIVRCCEGCFDEVSLLLTL